MSFEKKYKLDEFYLINEAGYLAIPFDGEFTVEIFGPDDWIIRDIALSAIRKSRPEELKSGGDFYQSALYFVDEGTTLFNMLSDRIYTCFSDDFNSAYHEKYGSGRSDYEEHCTYRVINGQAW